MELALVVLISVSLLGVVYVSIRGRATAIATAEDFEAQVKQVNLEALQNLMSSPDEAFLKETLSAADYREVEKARIRALLEYVAAISWNAVLFMRAAHVLQQHRSADVVAAAALISKEALELRVLSLTAELLLTLRLVVPVARIAPRGLGQVYGSLRQQVAEAWKLSAFSAQHSLDTLST